MSDERALLRAASERLARAGIDTPRLDVRVLWQAAAGPEEFDAFVARRETREPVAYITGHREFWSLDFLVEPGVLIPRPDTETMIEAVTKTFPDHAAPLSVLDLGTGSGCILAAILSEYPLATGLGVDANDVPLRIASKNMERLGLAFRASIQAGNWAGNLSARFDVVASNPPYIPAGDIAGLEPDVRDFEPVAALDGGPDGLDAVRLLAPAFKRLLKPETGTGFVEIGIGQSLDAAAIFSAAGLEVIGIVDDLSAVPRIVMVRTKKELE